MIGSIENWWIIITLFIGTLVELVTLALLVSFVLSFIWNTIKYRHEDKEFRENAKYAKEATW